MRTVYGPTITPTTAEYREIGNTTGFRQTTNCDASLVVFLYGPEKGKKIHRRKK